MSPQEESPGAASQATRLRWLIRAGVAAVALYLIADGLLGIWPDADSTTRVIVVVAVVVGLIAMGVGVLMLVRRDRAG